MNNIRIESTHACVSDLSQRTIPLFNIYVKPEDKTYSAINLFDLQDIEREAFVESREHREMPIYGPELTRLKDWARSDAYVMYKERLRRDFNESFLAGKDL